MSARSLTNSVLKDSLCRSLKMDHFVINLWALTHPAMRSALWTCAEASARRLWPSPRRSGGLEAAREPAAAGSGADPGTLAFCTFRTSVVRIRELSRPDLALLPHVRKGRYAGESTRNSSRRTPNWGSRWGCVALAYGFGGCWHGYFSCCGCWWILTENAFDVKCSSMWLLRGIKTVVKMGIFLNTEGYCDDEWETP